MWLTITTLFVLLISIFLHKSGCIPNSFWLTDSLEIELLGSGILAFLLFIGTSSLTKESEHNLQKKEAKDYFEGILLNNIKNAFKRIPSINVTSGQNNKMYFDNSCVNPLYDSINLYKHDIYRYLRYFSKDTLANKLLDFFKETEESYILGEKLDTLMLEMGKSKKISTSDLSRSIIYIKAVDYCGYPTKYVSDLLNEPHFTIQNFSENDEPFINKHYSGDLKGIDAEFRIKYKYLQEQVLTVRANLIKKSEEINEDIKSLLK